MRIKISAVMDVSLVLLAIAAGVVIGRARPVSSSFRRPFRHEPAAYGFTHILSFSLLTFVPSFALYVSEAICSHFMGEGQSLLDLHSMLQ